MIDQRGVVIGLRPRVGWLAIAQGREHVYEPGPPDAARGAADDRVLVHVPAQHVSGVRGERYRCRPQVSSSVRRLLFRSLSRWTDHARIAAGSPSGWRRERRRGCLYRAPDRRWRCRRTRWCGRRSPDRSAPMGFRHHPVRPEVGIVERHRAVEPGPSASAKYRSSLSATSWRHTISVVGATDGDRRSSAARRYAVSSSVGSILSGYQSAPPRAAPARCR